MESNDFPNYNFDILLYNMYVARVNGGRKILCYTLYNISFSLKALRPLYIIESYKLLLVESFFFQKKTHFQFPREKKIMHFAS